MPQYIDIDKHIFVTDTRGRKIETTVRHILDKNHGEYEIDDVQPTCENIGIEYADCDQFVCSKCGIELQDWHRVERDEDDGEVTYSMYVFRHCPNCGAKVEV